MKKELIIILSTLKISHFLLSLKIFLTYTYIAFNYTHLNVIQSHSSKNLACSFVSRRGVVNPLLVAFNVFWATETSLFRQTRVCTTTFPFEDCRFLLSSSCRNCNGNVISVSFLKGKSKALDFTLQDEAEVIYLPQRLWLSFNTHTHVHRHIPKYIWHNLCQERMKISLVKNSHRSWCPGT